MPEVTTFQIISASLGTVGAALGILNYWRSKDSDRVRLKVVPQIYRMTSEGRAIATTLDRMPKKTASDFPLEKMFDRGELAIQITYMSKFPVTIAHMGIGLTKDGDSMLLSELITTDDTPLPIRLDSRDSATFRRISPISRVHPKNSKVQVITACGYFTMADSPAFKRWIAQPNKETNKAEMATPRKPSD